MNDFILGSTFAQHMPHGNYAGYALFGGFFILIMVLWTLYWKIGALWEAARHGQRIWFVALLVVNTVGILEIVYLIWFRKDALPKHDSVFPLPPFERWMKKKEG